MQETEKVGNSKNIIAITHENHVYPLRTGEILPEGVVRFSSTRFGEIEVARNKIIHFIQGVYGFSDNKRFVLIGYEGDVPFMWLQSVDAPGLAFILMDPLLFKPDYRISLTESEVSDLGRPDNKDLIILVILTVPAGSPANITANMRAPLIINSATMKGKQVILQDERYPVKHPIL